MYRNKKKKIADQWASANSHTKLNLAKRRILNTWFTAEALKATYKVVDVPTVFTKLGYTWDKADGFHIWIRGLPTYKFNPEGASLLLLRYFEEAEKRAEANRQAVVAVARPMKQASINSMFRMPRASNSSSSSSN